MPEKFNIVRQCRHGLMVLMLESMQIQLKEEEKQRKKRQGIIEDEEGGE